MGRHYCRKYFLEVGKTAFVEAGAIPAPISRNYATTGTGKALALEIGF